MSEISVERSGSAAHPPRLAEVAIVPVDGGLDSRAISALRRRIASAPAAGRAVVVDLCALTASVVEAVELLCAAMRDVDREAARVTIAGRQPAIRLELERAGVDGTELGPTLGAAIAAAGVGRGRAEPATATRRGDHRRPAHMQLADGAETARPDGLRPRPAQSGPAAAVRRPGDVGAEPRQCWNRAISR